LCQNQRYHECIQLIAQKQPQFPQEAMLQFFWAFALNKMGDIEQAIAHYDTAITLDPHFPEAYYNLANICHQAGLFHKAVNAYKKALQCNPSYIEALSNLSETLQEMGRTDAAIKYHKKAIGIAPKNSKLYLSYAKTLSLANRPDEAITTLQKSLQFAPFDSDIYCQLGDVLIEKGKLDRGKVYLHIALKTNPMNTLAYFLLANAGKNAVSDEQVQKIKFLFEKKPLPPLDKTKLAFALGKIHNDRQDYQLAFPYWQMGNQLKRQQLRYTIQDDIQFHRDLKTTFTPDLFKAKFGNGFPSRCPIFIVGMPRSGTTLVEQILSSHSDVYGAGEIDLLGPTIKSIPKRYKTSLRYPQFLHELDNRHLYTLGQNMNKQLQKYDPFAPKITVKTPHHFLQLGYIALTLPNAKIIHCQRDPLDTCLSCYSLLFNGDTLPFSYDLNELGEHYTLYRSLMQHWRDTLPIPMFEIHYEDLLADPEKWSKALLAFCDLPWQEQCLHFHQNQRSVKTASQVQVRQPLYQTSKNRWKQYERFLSPLQEILNRP
jgi:tetratricopeptide (TPR) repeat protein